MKAKPYWKGIRDQNWHGIRALTLIYICDFNPSCATGRIVFFFSVSASFILHLVWLLFRWWPILRVCCFVEVDLICGGFDCFCGGCVEFGDFCGARSSVLALFLFFSVVCCGGSVVVGLTSLSVVDGEFCGGCKVVRRLLLTSVLRGSSASCDIGISLYR